MTPLQHEITHICNVFEENGEVMNAGWSRQPVFTYNEPMSKMSGKHGERDCYFVNNGEVSLYLSVENIGLEFAVKIAVADLKRGGVISAFVVKKINLIKNELPTESDKGEFLYSDKRLQLQLTNTPQGRILKGDFIDFANIRNLYFNLVLKKNMGDSLNVLAPFERNRKYFYLKRFVPKFVASGVIRVGGLEYRLSETDGRAYFDWTRFCKPLHHDYQRLSADCVIDGRRVSLCLASRVGDNRFGNENCFFVDGRLHKLDSMAVRGNPARLDRPFFFRSSSEADITFKPFTVGGEAMAAEMSASTVIFGRLYGEIDSRELSSPLVLDNTQAHLVFSGF